MGADNQASKVLDRIDRLQAAEKEIERLRQVRAGFVWHPIETAPQGDTDFFLVCAVGWTPFVVRGDILKSARAPDAPRHLHLHYLTHWMRLPDPPEGAKK